MSIMGNLQFGDNMFELEEANIYGIFEPYGYMAWNIEMFPEGDENYIMLNSVIFDNVYSPKNLSHINYNSADDLYEHTVIINGEDRFLQSLDMSFGEWNGEDQSISLKGHGIVDAEGASPEITYAFNATLKFNGLNIFETSPEATQQFINTHLPANKASLAVNYEEVPSGLQAIISGQF